MEIITGLFQNILYPFWYFLVLGLVYSGSRIAAFLLVGVGRLKAYHSIANYWIYLLVTVFCLMIGLAIGHDNMTIFYRWFICSQLAGLLGIYYGIDKGHTVSQKELENIEEDVDKADPGDDEW